MNGVSSTTYSSDVYQGSDSSSNAGDFPHPYMTPGEVVVYEADSELPDDQSKLMSNVSAIIQAAANDNLGAGLTEDQKKALAFAAELRDKGLHEMARVVEMEVAAQIVDSTDSQSVQIGDEQFTAADFRTSDETGHVASKMRQDALVFIESIAYGHNEPPTDAGSFTVDVFKFSYYAGNISEFNKPEADKLMAELEAAERYGVEADDALFQSVQAKMAGFLLFQHADVFLGLPSDSTAGVGLGLMIVFLDENPLIAGGLAQYIGSVAVQNQFTSDRGLDQQQLLEISQSKAFIVQHGQQMSQLASTLLQMA